MAETVSSVALDSATVVVGVDGAQVQSSTATATSSSTSVAGVAAANAKATNATGIQDSSLTCLLYTSPSPRDRTRSRMPSSA